MHKQIPLLDASLDQLVKPLKENCDILALSVKQRVDDMFDAVPDDDMLHIFGSSDHFLILCTYQSESDIAYESRYPSQLANHLGKYDAERDRQCKPYRNCDSCLPQKNYLSCLYYKHPTITAKGR